MTDQPIAGYSLLQASGFGSDEAARRLRRRRNAEVRLKAYGIFAISLAFMALATLGWSIISKTGSALTEHYIVLEFELPAEEIDPDGTGDGRVIGKADFGGITKQVLRDRFPGASGRTARRQLYDIVSAGASFELRTRVIENPDVMYGPMEFAFIASDVADLYFKGTYGGFEEQSRPAASALEVTELKKGQWQLETDRAVFGSVIAELQDVLLSQSRRLQRQAALQENGRRVFQERLQAATSEEDRTAFSREVAKRTARRDQLIESAEELVEIAKGEGGAVPLDGSMPSLVMRVGDDWYKLEEVEPSRAVATALSATAELPMQLADADWKFMVNMVPEKERKISDLQAVWLEELESAGSVEQELNWRFFSSGDSREPELAGILGAVTGTAWTMLVTFVLAFPVGVLSAVYLEEFAPRNRWTDLIEVNINNLAAVPSIVFGLLGLSVFIGFFGVPRSAPLAGGITLALMTLPTVIIASRAAIRAVPQSIRDAALGVGASKLQATFHHVLPLALPGILTGTIIGMAQALGETAPLIMIGMVAFIVDIPGGITDSATTLAVQVFRWSDLPERAFEARTAAAICVLLAFLILMNALAVFLRRRFERRW